MRTLLALVIATATGCAAHIQASTPRSVIVGTALTTPQKILDAAEAECHKQGLHARLNQASHGAAAFDCVP